MPPAREQWLLNASKTPTDQQCRDSAYSLAKELSLAAPMHGGLLWHLKTTTVPLALEQLSLAESVPASLEKHWLLLCHPAWHRDRSSCL